VQEEGRARSVGVVARSDEERRKKREGATRSSRGATCHALE
jgi:hypothetical protein